jgi:N-acetylglucosamine-6-phosphate deacetylase
VNQHETPPGYVDLHCHGGAGFYFSDPNPVNIRTAIEFHKALGTNQLVASLITDTVENLQTQIERLVPFFRDGSIAGIHLEGPYLSYARCGAHNASLLRTPNRNEVQSLIEIGDGAISMITIAPELESALDVISYLSKSDVLPAIGHSAGNYDDALKAVEAGAALVTHFSNGMSKLRDGEKSLTTALLYESSIPLELILDGHHVSREDIATIADRASDRIVLVTDAMAAAGQPDGNYTIGSLEVEVVSGTARLKSNGALAGSTLTMHKAVDNARDFGISDAIIENAARVLPQKLLDRTR